MKVSFSASALRERTEIQSEYFKKLSAENAKSNLYYMMFIAVSGIVLLTALIFITPHIIIGWSATTEYYLLYPVFLVFLIFSITAIKLKLTNYYLIQSMCVAMYVLMFAGFILISIFPYPDNVQVYISLFIMTMPALFIIRPSITLTVSIVMGTLFSVLAYEYKPYYIACQDIFSTIAAILFSGVLSCFIVYVRVEDYIMKKKLFKMGNTDMLTSLYNKQGCEYYCQEYMDAAGMEEHYTVIMMDMDNFKAINDTYGHVCGDNILRVFGGEIKGLFKADDVISRVGGDEFFILIKDMSDIEKIRQKAVAVLKICERIGQKVNITLGSSIGIVTVKDTKLTFEDLYKLSDRLLYESKNSGKNKYTIIEYENEKDLYSCKMRSS